MCNAFDRSTQSVADEFPVARQTRYLMLVRVGGKDSETVINAHCDGGTARVRNAEHRAVGTTRTDRCDLPRDIAGDESCHP